MGLRDALQAELLSAMKARDTGRVRALRLALAAVANAEAVDPDGAEPGATEVERAHLSEDQVRAVVRAEHADLLAAAEERHRLGLAAEAEELAAQAAVLAAHLDGGESALGSVRG